MKTIALVLGVLVCTLDVVEAVNFRGRSIFEAIKTVPPGASLEYRVNGQVIQSLPIEPGVYQISIKQMPVR